MTKKSLFETLGFLLKKNLENPLSRQAENQ
jgi:hypothetical protein